MGLFDRNRKANKMYYDTCVEAYQLHAEVEYDLAKRGTVVVPKLMKPGEKTVRAFLKTVPYSTERSWEAHTEYYPILRFCIEAGMAYAGAWRVAPKDLEGLVEGAVVFGPSAELRPMLRAYSPELLPAEQMDGFYEDFCKYWTSLIKPFWGWSEGVGEQNLYLSMLAAYQLGVSLTMDKLG